MSLRLRLVLALAPLFIVGVVIADAVTYATMRGTLYKTLDSQLFSIHQSVEQALLASYGYPTFGGGGAPGYGIPAGTYVDILSPSGQPILPGQTLETRDYTGPLPHPKLPPITAGLVHQSFDAPGSAGVGAYRVYVDDASMNGRSDQLGGDLLVVAIPADSVNNVLNQVLLLEAAITAALTLLVVGATWVIVRTGLRPLERMATTARSIAATDLSRRVEPSTESTEVGRLGLALNTMLAQLEAAFAERQRNEMRLRHFISDASHELRTPLTSMQGYAELLQRARTMDPADMQLALRRIEDETKRMSLLVDDLLLLARLDQGRPLERTQVDLDALVQDACADAAVADPGRRVSASVAAPLVVTGDEMRLRQVLGNLVRNAIVHTPPATPIELTLRPENSHALIEVIDHGRGVPPEQRTRIFERFHRLDPELSGDRGGSGLGLSIVAAVVQAHGGNVRVAETPGGGATFQVELPVVDGVPQHPPHPSPPPPPPVP